MRFDDKHRSGSLKPHAALYPDDGVTDVAVAPDGVGSAYLLNALNGLYLVSEPLAIDSHYLAFLKLNLQQSLLCLCDMFQECLLGQSLGRVEQLATADTRAPDAHIIGIFELGEVGVEAVSVEIINLLFARELLVAGESDNLHVRCHDEESHVEAYLIVACPRRAVCYGIGPYLVGIACDGDSLEYTFR